MKQQNMRELNGKDSLIGQQKSHIKLVVTVLIHFGLVDQVVIQVNSLEKELILQHLGVMF